MIDFTFSVDRPALTARTPWYERQPSIYILRRADGWHKIGHSFVDPIDRAKSVAGSMGVSRQSIKVIWFVKVSRENYLRIERMAHRIMDDAGFARDRHRETEWFKASAKICIKAVNASLNDAALAKMPGWNLQAAYREFGGSKRPPGPRKPRKQKRERL